ncbi:MAG: hypothetical protein JST28_08915 [Acidobacteria bacterium]|nr:hypothetical protein [Acidobacteriota bacterium]
MAKFCGTCGSPLNEGQKFCGKCGTGSSVQQQSVPSPVQTLNAPSPSSPPLEVTAPTPARSNTLLKVGVALVLIVLVGSAAALGAVYYAVHKVKQKVQAVSKQSLGDNAASHEGGLASLLQKAASSAKADDASSSDGEFKGDPCRFLSNPDVSRAVGVEIVRTQAQDGGCSYFAKGDPADMVSKHMSAMVTSQAKANGSHPTADQTKLMQQISGAFFKQQEASDKDLSKEASTGEVLILSVSFSTGNAELEMKMNRAAFNHVTGGNADGKTTDQKASGDLDGIGDDAYEMGGSGLIFRKGQTVVHMMFPECPCDANAIKPLATSIANQL